MRVRFSPFRLAASVDWGENLVAMITTGKLKIAKITLCYLGVAKQKVEKYLHMLW